MGMMGMNGGSMMMGPNGEMIEDQGSTWMQSIEHVVMAFGKVSWLLEGNHQALHQFFMSVMFLVDRFTMLHETMGNFFSGAPNSLQANEYTSSIESCDRIKITVLAFR